MKKKQYLYAISYWGTDKERCRGQNCGLITRLLEVVLND